MEHRCDQKQLALNVSGPIHNTIGNKRILLHVEDVLLVKRRLKQGHLKVSNTIHTSIVSCALLAAATHVYCLIASSLVEWLETSRMVFPSSN